MADMLNIDEGFNTYQDDNLCFINEFENKEFNLQSGLIFVSRDEFETNRVEALKKISDTKNQSWGILQEEVAAMLNEKDRLIKLFHKFYSSSISNDPLIKDSTPRQIQYIINKLLIRVKRLDCVLDTKYTSTKFTEKKTGRTYLMAKGYYIDSNGTRVRNISRSITNTEYSITELTMKLLKINFKSATLMEVGKSEKFMADFIVYDGKKQWMVENKNQNTDNLVKTFIMFETWKMYKEDYELLT